MLAPGRMALTERDTAKLDSGLFGSEPITEYIRTRSDDLVGAVVEEEEEVVKDADADEDDPGEDESW